MKVSHGTEAAAEGGISDVIVRVRDALRRRWLTLALVSVAVFALGIGLIALMTPQYTATARVQLDPSRSGATEQPQGGDAQALTPEAIETELSLIRSEDLARRVVAKLGLARDPELTKGLDSSSGVPVSPADREDAAVNNLLKRVGAAREKLSYILQISYTSQNSAHAARITNALADAYLFAKVGSKATSASKRSDFLAQQVALLGANIRQEEAQVAAYQAAAGLSSGTTASGATMGTIVDQEVGPLSSELAQAKSDAASAEAGLAAAHAQAANGGSESVAEVLASPVVAQLRAQRAQALQQIGDATARYGEKYPDVIRIRGQIADIDAQIRAESRRILSSLQARSQAANARAASLQASMSELGAKQATNTRNAVLATTLTAEIQSKRAQYDKLSQASLEATQAANNSIAQAEIIDRATAPSRPTSPNKVLFGALALLVALAAGVATITVQELMAAGFRSVTDVENRLGIPLIAAVPRVKAEHPADLLMEKPTSMFAEALRIARASILGVGGTKAPKIIALTSALPSEGKTTTALALARMLAINGQRTLLIDCDVRRALMRESVRSPSDGPGLVELLHGEAPVERAIGPGDIPNLDQLLVRAPWFSSENLFGDGKMEQVLAGLRSRYELIVLDLPPLLGLADGRFLAAMADTTALVIRWDSTPIAAASSALSSIQADGTTVAGAIFTMVDTGAEAAGGMYYSKKYAGYYQAG